MSYVIVIISPCMVRVYKVLVYGSASGHDFDAVCTVYSIKS